MIQYSRIFPDTSFVREGYPVQGRGFPNQRLRIVVVSGEEDLGTYLLYDVFENLLSFLGGREVSFADRARGPCGEAFNAASVLGIAREAKILYPLAIDFVWMKVEHE